jgi:uncharacterized Zn finger protein (UPF0148 family)
MTRFTHTARCTGCKLLFRTPRRGAFFCPFCERHGVENEKALTENVTTAVIDIGTPVPRPEWRR